MSKLFVFACLCIALFAVANAEKTLFVDTVFPSATTATLLETLTGDTANVQDASVGSLNLNLPDGLVISTEGPVSLEGSFVSVQSDVSTNINASGDIITDSSDRTSITGSDVHFNVGDDFLLSSRAGHVDVVSHTGFTTEADENFISSDGAVTFNAGSGPIDIFSDDLVAVNAVNTDIFGENRVSIFAQHLLSLNADSNLEAVSDNIDLDALGDVTVTSTSSNIELIGGNQMIFQADFINVDGERGIDVTSRHGLVSLHSDGNASVSGENVNVHGQQDTTVWSGTNLTVTATAFQADALKNVDVRANDLVQNVGDFSVNGGEFIVDTQEAITINLSGGSADVLTATHHAEIRSSVITADATTTLSATTSNDGDIYFASHQEEDSSVAMTAVTATLSATDNFRVKSGDVFIDSSDDVSFSASDDITLETSTGATDSTAFFAETIAFTIAGDSEIDTHFTNIAADDVVYVGGCDVTFAGGDEPEEVTRIFTETITLDAESTLIHAEGDLTFHSDMTFTGSGNFAGDLYDDMSMSVSDAATFTAGSALAISATRFESVSEEIDISAIAGVTFTASDELIFDSAAEMEFLSGTSFDWNTDRSVQFDAFDDINIDSMVAINGGTILFEGGAGTEIDGAGTITTQATTIDVETNFNGDVSWSGETLTVSSGVLTDIKGISVSVEGGGSIEIYGSIDNPQGTVNINTAEGSGHSVQFSANDVAIDANNADPLFNANSISLTASTNDVAFTAGGHVDFTADSSIVSVFSGAATHSSSTWSATSGGNLSFTGVGNFDVSSNGAATIAIERATTATASGFLSMSSAERNIAVASQGSIIIDNSAAPATADPLFTLDAGDDIIITADTYTQNGGNVANIFGQSTTFAAKERVSLNSYISTHITADQFVFDATNDGDNIRFEARDFFASADQDNVNFLGGDITFVTGENQGITTSAASSLLLETNQLNPFTWQTLDDFNSTAGAYEIVAHNSSDSNIGIRFLSTDALGDIVVLSRNGEIRLVADQDHTYTANHIEMYSVGDMYFSNVLRPSSGGITLQAAGSRFDPAYGDDVGASFRASGADGVIYMLPETGAAHFSANEDIGLLSATGGLTVDAKTTMPFTTTDGGVELFAHWGDVSITADRNNLTMTTPLDSEVRASANINLQSTDSMRLTAVTDRALQAENNVGMEFSVHTGHIQMLADSNEDITWTTPLNYRVQSGDQVSITASDDITFTATNGHFDMHGDTGLGYYVLNGDMHHLASDNIHVTSAENEYINVQSGFENNWTAIEGSISITSLDGADQHETPVDHAADQTGIAMRTERGDVLFQALDGNIRYLTTGRLQLQSDGTNNNVAGADVDGIFLVAPEIDSLSTHETVWDAESTVRIGANTNPIITFEAGGDARAAGVTVTSEGGANLSTQNDFLITSAGDYSTASVLESDFIVSGDVTISSVGTSPTGRNVDFETAGEFDVDANTVDITGQDSVFVSSAGFLQLTSTGNDPTTAFIDFSAVTDMFINVNGTFDVDVDSWTITTDTMEMLSNGFISFSNVNGASSGDITVVADADLSLSSDVAQTYDSREGSMNIVTTSTNGDIAIDANSPTSGIFFYTGGEGEAFGFSMTARDEVDIDTLRSLSITARDQDDDDQEDGNMTLTSSNDFEFFASRNLVVEGAKGLSLGTTNPTGTDVDIESDGFTNIVSWEDMEFRSTSDEMTIEADYDILFTTHDEQNGSIITSSTRDVILTAEEGVYLVVDGDYSLVGGRTVHWQANSGLLSFTTEGFDAVFSITAEQGELLLDAEEMLGNFGSLDMSATGEATITTVSSQQFVTQGRHSNVVFESEQGELTVYAATGQEFVAAHVGRLLETDLTESFNGAGIIEATTSGSHPTEGYGMRLEAIDMDVSTRGFVKLHAPLGTVNVAAEQTIGLVAEASFTLPTANLHEGDSSGGQESFTDGNAVYIAAKGPGGNVNVTSTDDITLESDRAFTVQAANGIEIDSFFDTVFDSSASVGSGADFVAESNHPYADLIITATDFLEGSISIDAGNEIDIYGRFGVVLELQDDDDQESSGEYTIDASQFQATGRNDVVLLVDGGGDLVVDSESVEFVAGGDFIVEFRQAANLDSDALFSITTQGNVRFDSGEDLDVDAEGDFTANVGGAFLNTLGGNLRFDAEGDISMASGSGTTNDFQSQSQEVSLSSAGDFFIDANTITLRTNRDGSVDFREGLKIPFVSSNNNERSTGAPCNAVGGARSLFYDPWYKQICYCSASTSTLSCQFAYQTTYLGP